ncbi:hypothetical protein I4F81_011965 [Pyropia yezoensis]|uniref:Uncharacterized protein n=1 Tax=Pyropia yezoensis TaxID=2788 RepID=A0ACC3CH41_PYRYE|nr:hypothetical protein I4F81_011965 [Neopyropia yezoensis]
MQGSEDLTALLITWLRDAVGRGEELQPENVLITTGSGPALDLILHLFTSPGDAVFCDSPGYFLAFPSFRDCGLRVVDVPTDGAGMDVEAVAARCAAGEVPRVVYTVPIGANPTGATMTDDRRRRLVGLARQYGFFIVADEVYQLLTYDGGAPPPSLAQFDTDPDRRVVARLVGAGAIQSGGGLNPFTSAVVAELFRSGAAQRHVVAVRDAYAASATVLCDALDAELPPVLGGATCFRYLRPSGGFFVFVRLASGVDTEEVLRAYAPAAGVVFFAGRHFASGAPGGEAYAHALRVCFAFLDAAPLREGVRRLAAALKAYMADHPELVGVPAA